MNQILSILCSIVAVLVVGGVALYAVYCAILAVFGEGEAGQAMVVTALCVALFFGLMTVMAKFNSRESS